MLSFIALWVLVLSLVVPVWFVSHVSVLMTEKVQARNTAFFKIQSAFDEFAEKANQEKAELEQKCAKYRKDLYQLQQKYQEMEKNNADSLENMAAWQSSSKKIYELEKIKYMEKCDKKIQNMMASCDSALKAAGDWKMLYRSEKSEAESLAKWKAKVIANQTEFHDLMHQQ